MIRRTIALVLPLALSGCTGLLGELGGGTTVSGLIKAPETQQAAIAFTDAYRIAGTIAGERAVPEAEVRAYAADGNAIGAAVKANKSGLFEIKGLPSGKAVILVATTKAKSGGTLRITAFVKPAGTSTARDLNTASTIVADKLKASLSAAKLEAVSQNDVDILEGRVSNSLDTADIPDLSKDGAAVAAFGKVEQKNSSIANAFASISEGRAVASVR
ncbi:hypothetical protein J7643_11525 [bacterium]|nr:hypothetical protein [bacterium]